MVGGELPGGRRTSDRRQAGLWPQVLPLSEEGGPCHSSKEQRCDITVTLNKSKTLRFTDPFSTAVIGAPDIADILPMTEETLYVLGKKIGTTNISVFAAAAPDRSRRP